MMNIGINDLTWGKCVNNIWCPLYSLNLNHSLFNNLEGVYIIWYWDNLGSPKTVKVGQGNIRTRLTVHRENFPELYPDQELLVTWTSVPSIYQDGVENYVGNRLQPEGTYPDVSPIPVNLPW